MNESVLDIFNLSLTIQTMSDHKCNELGCKGQKYAGLNITCGMCLMPCYFECISNRSEVVHLFRQMNINNIPENDQKKINEEHLKIKSLFGVNSVFEFVCPSCKGESTLYDIFKKFGDDLKQKNEDLEKKNKDLTKKNTKANSEVRELKSKLNDKESQQIQQVNHDTNDFEQEIATLKSQFEQKKSDIEKSIDELNMALTTQQSQFEKFKEDTDNNFKCSVELLKKISLCVSDQEDNDDENDDTDLFNAPSQMNRDSRRDPGFHDENSRQKQYKDNYQFSRPSTSNQRNSHQANSNNRTELREIYISPFQTSVQCDDIIRFILNKTKIKDSSIFSVQRLGGYDRMRSYVSFRVSTLNNDVYKAILSNEL